MATESTDPRVARISPSVTLATSTGGACPFLDKLPVELRLKIYGHFLSSQRPLKQIHASQRPVKLRDPPDSGPWYKAGDNSIVQANIPILLLNKQIHSEVQLVFYDSVTISLPHDHICLKADCTTICTCELTAKLSPPIDMNRVRHLEVIDNRKGKYYIGILSAKQLASAVLDPAQRFLQCLIQLPTLQNIEIKCPSILGFGINCCQLEKLLHSLPVSSDTVIREARVGLIRIAGIRQHMTVECENLMAVWSQSCYTSSTPLAFVNDKDVDLVRLNQSFQYIKNLANNYGLTSPELKPFFEMSPGASRN